MRAILLFALAIGVVGSLGCRSGSSPKSELVGLWQSEPTEGFQATVAYLGDGTFDERMLQNEKEFQHQRGRWDVAHGKLIRTFDVDPKGGVAMHPESLGLKFEGHDAFRLTSGVGTKAESGRFRRQ